MAEYIERQKVIDITAETGALETQRRVQELPAADVAPVVHAKWINLPKYKSVGGTLKKAQICSACNAFYVSDADIPFSNHRYCADCGAKMDLEESK